MNNAKHVWYNDGTDKTKYALVLRDHGGGFLDVMVLEGALRGEIRENVPRRELKDYEADNGVTWHS